MDVWYTSYIQGLVQGSKFLKTSLSFWTNKQKKPKKKEHGITHSINPAAGLFKYLWPFCYHHALKG